jgi:chromate transport protein ChrA
MSSHSAPVTLAMHLALLSCISFGGFPSVLPDIHNFVTANGWVTDQEFSNFFALAQAVPGPNMILLMSLIGWNVGEFLVRSSAPPQCSGRPAQCILRPTSCRIGFVTQRGK